MIKIQTPFGIGEFLGMETDIEAVSTGIASCPIRHDIRGPAMSSVMFDDGSVTSFPAKDCKLILDKNS